MQNINHKNQFSIAKRFQWLGLALVFAVPLQSQAEEFELGSRLGPWATHMSRVLESTSVSTEDASNDTPSVEQLLVNLQSQFTQLEVSVHRHDRPRAVILTLSATRALEAFRRNPIHRDTQHALFMLHMRVSISREYLEFVGNASNQPLIETIQNDHKALTEELGLEDAPYSRILFVNQREILDLVNRLVEVCTNVDLKKALQNYLPVLGHAMAAAQNGDRPSAFTKAAEAYIYLKKIYHPLEREFGSSRLHSRLYLELVGLNEFIGRFAEADGQ